MSLAPQKSVILFRIQTDTANQDPAGKKFKVEVRLTSVFMVVVPGSGSTLASCMGAGQGCPWTEVFTLHCVSQRAAGSFPATHEAVRQMPFFHSFHPVSVGELGPKHKQDTIWQIHTQNCSKWGKVEEITPRFGTDKDQGFPYQPIWINIVLEDLARAIRIKKGGGWEEAVQIGKTKAKLSLLEDDM